MPAWLMQLLFMLGGSAASEAGMAVGRRYLGKAALGAAEKAALRVAPKIPTAAARKFLTPQRLARAAGAGAGILAGTALFGAGSYGTESLLGGLGNEDPYTPHGAESLVGAPASQTLPDINSLIAQLTASTDGEEDSGNPRLETLIRDSAEQVMGGRLV